MSTLLGVGTTTPEGSQPQSSSVAAAAAPVGASSESCSGAASRDEKTAGRLLTAIEKEVLVGANIVTTSNAARRARETGDETRGTNDATAGRSIDG